MRTDTRFSIHYFTLFAVMAAAGPYFALLLEAQGFTKPEIGLLQGFRSAAAVFGPMLVGYLADRLGKRRILLTLCLLAFGLLMIPLARTHSFLLATGIMLAMGMVGRTSVPLTDALAAAELDDPARNYGRVRVWGSISFALVLIVIRLFRLVDEGSSMSILRCILLMMGFCVVSSQLLPDRHRPEHHEAESAGGGEGGFDAAFWLFVAIAACHGVGMSAHYSFFVLYLKDVLHLEYAAWVWAVGAAAEVPLMYFSARLIRRFGIMNVIAVALVGVSVRLLVYALLPVTWAVLPIQLVHGVTFGLYHAAGIEFVRRKVSPARRGLAMALYMSLAGGGAALFGSSLGGFIIESWGYSALYLIYAGGPLLGVAMLWPARRWLTASMRPAD